MKSLKITKKENKAVKPRKILFVCTGNIFRSMSAKYCLMDYIKKKGIEDVFVDSAGTIADDFPMNSEVRSTLISLGINPDDHRQRKLERKDLEDFDIIITMAENHNDFIKENFDFEDSVLFNEVANNKKESVDDLSEAIEDPDNEKNRKVADKYLRDTVIYIHKNTPKLYENLDRYLIFLDFIHGRRDHGNGLPFIPLYETENTISFMSIAIPQNQDGHILVIPKKRYSNLDRIPKDELNELSHVVSKMGNVMRKTHSGYNIILNNGDSAGQQIMHTHFHVIPRDDKDKIKVGVWKDKKLTPKEFIELNNKMKAVIE